MVTTKKTPAIRFQAFDEEWEEKALENLAQFFRGKLLSWKDIVDDGKYECILYGNLYTHYGMIINNVIYKTNAILDDNVLSKYGDVLIPSSDTTPTGLARASCIEKDNVILGGDINVIRPASFVNGSFLSLNLNSHKTELIKLIKGSTVRHLDNSDIKKIILYISKSIIEQTQIGNYFKELDVLIQNQEGMLEKVKNLKKAMLEKMFPKENVDVPEIRFKGFTNKWEKKKLKDISNKIGDGLHGTPNYTDNGNIYFINGNNLCEGRIFINNEVKCVKELDQSINDRSLNTETILLSINGTIGNLAFYNGEKIMLGKSVAYVNLNQVEKTFIYAYLQTTFIIRYFDQNLTGSTIKNLGLKTIRNTYFYLPAIQEQQKIGTYFQNLDQLLNQSQLKIKQLKNLKQALLQKMFI